MSAGCYQIRRAHRAYTCSYRSFHRILDGDLYLRIDTPPWHEFACAKHWVSEYVCLRCVEREGLHTDQTRAQLAARQPKAGHDR